MNYLYHMLPKNMKGSILYSLHQLKERYPIIYQKENDKYKGRAFVKQTKILPLNCRWNEVLFLSPVHPSKIKRHHHKHQFPFRKNVSFVKINPYHLEPELTTLWSSPKPGLSKPSDFTSFRPENLSKYNSITRQSELYFSKRKKEGKNPLSWAFLAHVLYKGQIDITKEEIIKL